MGSEGGWGSINISWLRFCTGKSSDIVQQQIFPLQVGEDLDIVVSVITVKCLFKIYKNPDTDINWLLNAAFLMNVTSGGTTYNKKEGSVAFTDGDYATCETAGVSWK